MPLEMKPLVYETWPNARMVKVTPNNSLLTVPEYWEDYVQPLPGNIYLNSTVLDDVFEWGEKYGRQPPAFPMVQTPSRIFFVF